MNLENLRQYAPHLLETQSVKQTMHDLEDNEDGIDQVYRLMTTKKMSLKKAKDLFQQLANALSDE